MTFTAQHLSIDLAPLSTAAIEALPTSKILGLALVDASLPATLDWIGARMEHALPTRIAFVNAHCANVAAHDRSYRRALLSADALLPDGAGVALAARFKAVPLTANLNGTDLVPALCQRMAAAGRSVFLLGGRPGVAEDAGEALRQAHPGLRIAGTQHGYFDPEDEAEIVKRIESSQADLLLVAFGVPMQDVWLQRVARYLSTPITMGVGGLFDFLSGRIPRAPSVVRRLNLEWAFRLYQEPARMWRRYVLGNPTFVVRALRDAAPERVAGLRRTIDLSAKRALDIGVAGGALLVGLPSLLFVGAAIKLTTPGPALLRQTRIGKDGVPFTLYKFRSMYVDADARRAALAALNVHGADGITFKLQRDPRVTPLGRWLRRSSIDEVPQLWNVIKGNMSLVGPRPPLPAEVERYTDTQRRRLAGRPGLTCLWQVSGRANLPFTRQVELDIEYLKRRSFVVDLSILLKTIPAVLTARGAY